MDTETRELSGADYWGNSGTDSKDLSKVLFGALAGAAAGSVIGVLFTEKGTQARKRLGKGSKNIANNLKGKVSGIKDKVSNIKENIADKYAATKENIADKYAATKEGAANLIQKGKQKVGMSSGSTAYRGTTGTDEGDSGSNVLIGALAAAVAGAVIWSFATEKGTETRKRLGKGSKDMANNLKSKFSDIADNVADKYQAAKEGAADLVEKTKQQNNMSTGNTAYKGSTSFDTFES